MSGKVLVTGATGLVGNEVVKGLLKRGCEVKAASRAGVEVPGAEPVAFSFGDPDKQLAALEDVDRVFLLVPSQLLAQADEVVPRFVERMEAAGTTRVVCMTGMTAERPDAPMNSVEASVQQSDMNHTILRPNWFNQNFAPGFYLEMMKGAGALFIPAGDAKLSFVDTRDIGEVAAVSLTQSGHEGMEYTLTGPEALNHFQACEIISRVANREIRYVPITDDDLREALTTQGLPPEGVEGMVALYQLTRAGLCEPVSPDVESVLGRPAISFAQFAEDYGQYLQ